MNTDKLLNMLLAAIDYSFLQTDGSYDKTLTYPVIDKVKYIKSQINDNEVKEVDLEKEYKDFVEEDPVYNKLVNGIVGKGIAKHFFELGLKAQKGE